MQGMLDLSRTSIIALALGALTLMALPAHADDGPSSGAAPPSESPRQFIDRVSKDVIGILGNKELTTQQKSDKIQAIAFTNIDLPVVSQLTLGSTWRGLNHQQREDFMKEYRTHLANTYRSMIDNYTDEQVQTVGERQEQRGDRTVLTKIIDPKGGDPLKANYRVRQENGAWRVVDITVEGVSLVANFQAQFQDIVNNRGFDGLMQMLRQKNAEAAKGAQTQKAATTQPAG